MEEMASDNKKKAKKRWLIFNMILCCIMVILWIFMCVNIIYTAIVTKDSSLKGYIIITFSGIILSVFHLVTTYTKFS